MRITLNCFVVCGFAGLIACSGGGSFSNDQSTPASLPIKNQAPVANAGADRSMLVGSTINLSGIASSDANGDGLSYQWASVIQSQEVMINFGSPSSVNTSFSADSVGQYTIILTVSDGQLSHSDQLVVNVVDVTNQPVFDFSSLLGGGAMEGIESIAFDAQGNIYIAGQTASTDFPTMPADVFQPGKSGPAGTSDRDFEALDGFVAKLSPDGRNIIWSTYIGGSRRETIQGVRVDSQGFVYLIGSTGSSDFPTKNAIDATYNSAYGGPNALGEVVVVKLTPDGKDLVFSTFIGGTDDTEENPRGALALDEAGGKLYVAGLTNATDFPTTGAAYQSSYGGGNYDAFVFALSLDGASLVHSTYLGGSGHDFAYSGIAIHSNSQSVYVGGASNSTDIFPTSITGYQPTLQSLDQNPEREVWENGDGFVARFNADLTTILNASYIGGGGYDSVSHNHGLTLNGNNQPVAILMTNSTDFPTSPSAFDSSYGGVIDGAVTILSEDLKALVASSFLGGGGEEEIAGVATDSLGNVYATGRTSSDDFPTQINHAVNASTPSVIYHGNNAQDVFITAFNSNLSDIHYSAYLGGQHDLGTQQERARICAVNDSRLICGGTTGSPDFPASNILQNGYGGGPRDAFLSTFLIP